MGHVTEYESVLRELGEMKKDASGVVLASTILNGCNELTITARPKSYDILIKGDLVYAFKEIENAKKVYDIIRADAAGKVYGGR